MDDFSSSRRKIKTYNHLSFRPEIRLSVVIAPSASKDGMVRITRMRCSIGLAVLLSLLMSNLLAHAQDLIKDAVPNRWMQLWMPEELPEAPTPGYFNDVDKAKAAVFH